MFRSLRSFLPLAALAATLLPNPTLRAQTGERSRFDQITLGNNYVGVDIIGWARSRNTGTERRVDEAAWTQLRLLNVSVELQRIAATAIRNGASFSAATSLRRGGLTVRNDSLSASGTVSYSSSANVFGSNPYLTIVVFGIPITLGANVGHTGVMNMSLLNWSTNGSMLSGSMDAYAFGWASAAVGIPGLQAGVEADIRIGRQRFDGVLSAFTNYLGTAYLAYSMTPIRLLLRVFLEIGFINPSVTLVDVALAARTLAPFIP